MYKKANKRCVICINSFPKKKKKKKKTTILNKTENIMRQISEIRGIILQFQVAFNSRFKAFGAHLHSLTEKWISPWVKLRFIWAAEKGGLRIFK